MKEIKDKACVISKNGFCVAFGNHNLKLPDLQKFNPRWLHQVHGSHIVKATSKVVEADGQWTDSKNQALVIKTADCLPIFIFDGVQIFALHAGWRGVKKRIVTKALEMCREPSRSQIFIGPHIQMRSFQLDHDSAQGLLKEHNLKVSKALEQSIARSSITQKNHYHISLSQLVVREAQAYGCKPPYISQIDTFLSPYHNSYRRNRLNKERNFSFASLNN